MRLVTIFDLSRFAPERLGSQACFTPSHTARNSERSLMRWAPQSAESSDAGTPHTFSLYVLKKCRYRRQPKRPAMKPSSVSWFFGGWTLAHRYDATHRVASTGPRLRSAFIGTSG